MDDMIGIDIMPAPKDRVMVAVKEKALAYTYLLQYYSVLLACFDS